MPFSVDLDGEKHTKSLIGWSICLFELLASPPTKMFGTSNRPEAWSCSAQACRVRMGHNEVPFGRTSPRGRARARVGGAWLHQLQKHLKKEFWLSQNSHPGAAGGAPRSVRGAAPAGATGRARVGAATNKPSTGS